MQARFGEDDETRGTETYGDGPPDPVNRRGPEFQPVHVRHAFAKPDELFLI